MRDYMEVPPLNRSSEYRWQQLPNPIPLHVFDTYAEVQTVLSQPSVFEPTGHGSAALFDANFGSPVFDCIQRSRDVTLLISV